MRLIDADKIDFGEVFIGASDFAKDTRNTAQELIDSQPTINEWIPCSERLPEDIDENLIECYLVTDGFLIWMAYYKSNIGWVFAECTNSDKIIDWTEITAWCKLPQPYKPN